MLFFKGLKCQKQKFGHSEWCLKHGGCNIVKWQVDLHCKPIVLFKTSHIYTHLYTTGRDNLLGLTHTQTSNMNLDNFHRLIYWPFWTFSRPFIYVPHSRIFSQTHLHKNLGSRWFPQMHAKGSRKHSVLQCAAEINDLINTGFLTF